MGTTKKNKKTVEVVVNASVTEEDLLSMMGQCSSTAILPSANVRLSRERFAEVIKQYKTFDEVKNYLLSLESRSYSFDVLGDEIKKAANTYGKYVASPNFVFHGALMDRELEKSTYISNLTPETANELIVLFFRNCQMSSLFREVIVGTYMLCKKKGIDNGDSPANGKK